MAQLVCFTNCFLPQEDGELVRKDLWIDAQSGHILDAQKTFYAARQRPTTIVDLGGNILSPGFLDIQINGAYGFDFSIYEDDQRYNDGLRMVASRIVETGVTSLLPTIITQQRSLYPKLLSLLGPHAYPPTAASSEIQSSSSSVLTTSKDGGATLLGWHAEGPFLQTAKRGAHSQPFLVSAPERIASFEDVYGAENLKQGNFGEVGVRVITAAPEVDGVMDSIDPLTKRGVIFSIGHSIATSPLATRAVLSGARLITHLFNAMPQLHHRDPAIIGLLGAGGLYSTGEVGEIPSAGSLSSPHVSLPGSPPIVSRSPSHVSPSKLEKKISALALSSPAIPNTSSASGDTTPQRKTRDGAAGAAEALDDLLTPPMTPILSPTTVAKRQSVGGTKAKGGSGDYKMNTTLQRKGMPSVTPGDTYARPYYGLIVDGIHSHPNSVRLAYTAHPEGCILVTDAMSFLDPHLPDGPHDWRDGRRVFKKGDKLVIDQTDTLAGSVVTLDTCIRNFSLFTSTPLGKSLLCATLHPARCLGIEERKGTLRAGADADLVVLDWEGRPLQTWVAGRKVWAKADPSATV